MLYAVSADALQGFRLMPDTPVHEGVERGRAAVQGGDGGPQRRANGDGGGAGPGREPANDACVAGSLRTTGHGGDGRRPVANRLPPADAGPHRVRVLEMRRHKPFCGPRRLVLELAKKGVTPTPVGLSNLSRSTPGGLDSAGSAAVATRGMETLGAGRGD